MAEKNQIHTTFIRLVRKNERIHLKPDIRLIVHANRHMAPFSWMKYIVISKTDLAEAGETILLHEQAHLRQRHTADLLFAELGFP